MTSTGWLVEGKLRSWWALLLVLALLSPREATGYGTEISGTVSLFRNQELNEMEYINGKTASRCEHMVDRVWSYGGTKINFMVTHFFVDPSGDLTPDYYCYKPDSTEECLPFTQAAINTWLELFTPCLQYAVWRGFTGISFTPHLDDGLGQGQWRNKMLINPLAKHRGFSYTDIMLLPLARAMSSVMTDNLTVWYALQGEMSVMVFRYPQEHQRLLPYLKSIIIGNNRGWASQVRMGVSTNYNKLCGEVECNPLVNQTDPIYRQKPAVQALFNAVDFIGCSSYTRFERGNLATFEEATVTFAKELTAFGLDLELLLTAGGKELVLSEFGVGGGATATGDTPARNYTEAYMYPYYGVFGSYTRKLDPWNNHLPATVVAQTKQYLEDWYRGAAMWLARKGGPVYRVDAVFLWNLNSWDIIGIHPTSNNKEGTYRNDAVAEAIKGHNIRLRGEPWGALNMNPGSFAPY